MISKSEQYVEHGKIILVFAILNQMDCIVNWWLHAAIFAILPAMHSDTIRHEVADWLMII